MNLRDENFKDAHLQKALRHAPDNDIAPSASTQKAVLDYAENALKLGQKPHAESWLTRLKKAINAWQLPRWQMAGMGSLAASLLVVVMIWHENSDDPLQVAAAPDVVQRDAAPNVKPELTQNELANAEVNQAEQSAQIVAEAAPEGASADSTAPNTQAKVIAKSSKQEAETAPTDKTILAAAPEGASGQVPEKDVDSTKAKETTVFAEAAPPAPMTAAPAATSVTANEPSAARTTEITSARKKMAAAEKADVTAKANASSDSQGNSEVSEKSRKTTRHIGDDLLANTIEQTGGVALANQDIQAGKLRILVIAVHDGKFSECEDSYSASTEQRADAQTAYKIEEINVCIANQQLAKEVANYNKTMREWHKAQH